MMLFMHHGHAHSEHKDHVNGNSAPPKPQPETRPLPHGGVLAYGLWGLVLTDQPYYRAHCADAGITATPIAFDAPTIYGDINCVISGRPWQR